MLVLRESGDTVWLWIGESGVLRCRGRRVQKGGERYGGASVFILNGGWECYNFENTLFIKVDNVCRQIDVYLPFAGLGVGGV